MREQDSDKVAHIVLYGATSEEITDQLSEYEIGRINEYVANMMVEVGVDIDVGLASGERGEKLRRFDQELLTKKNES